jgi:hypothetical protein
MRLINWLLLLSFLLLKAPPAHAEIGMPASLHHFFNARLLEPGSMQLSIMTNFKGGVTDSVELGSNLLTDVMGVPNLSIKHKMFDLAKAQTSFTGHGFLIPKRGDFEANSLISLHGIVTTHELNPDNYFNWGLMDIMFYMSGNASNSSSLHVPTALLGSDYAFNQRFVGSLIVLQPLYILADVKSDAVNVNLQSDMISRGYVPPVLMLSGTLAFKVYHLEFNLLNAMGESTGYINMWWRFK